MATNKNLINGGNMTRWKREMQSRKSKHLYALPRIRTISPQPLPLNLALKAM